jgi:hypothetical protein
MPRAGRAPDGEGRRAKRRSLARRPQRTNWSCRLQRRASHDSASSLAAPAARFRPNPSLASYAAAMRSPSVITIFLDSLGGAARREVFMSGLLASEMPGEREWADHAISGGWVSPVDPPRTFNRSQRTFTEGERDAGRYTTGSAPWSLPSNRGNAPGAILASQGPNDRRCAEQGNSRPLLKICRRM